jgi:hypothetical protein
MPDLIRHPFVECFSRGMDSGLHRNDKRILMPDSDSGK